jgi:sulfur-oxidizing protein SoxZ
MAKGMRVQAKIKNGQVNIKALMNHPMETGGRKDKKTGKLIPAHFISDITCTHKGENVLTAEWSGGVSKNPYLAFKFTGGVSGDAVKLSWVDNTGGKDELEVKIK